MTATYRFREYTIRPDDEPDAEPHTYAMQCAVCETSGSPSNESPDPTSWAFEHVREYPEHLTYREIITRPYHAVPGELL
ncbi:hypothetical protein [Streptomyces sp. Da 82-17]|uniref:DUF7848 domain-containing protein n=1 Tax=Streptomyces sp. Da 82-17 TaxID=3377116 RepID=UPI0038D45384